MFGFWRAQRSGSDDIELFENAESRTPIATLHHLRQQSKKGAAGPHFSLADFVAPSPHVDYVGAFAVNAGTGIEKVVAKFEAANDDYNAIMLKALADRLAEAFAERLHERVRKEFWGYSRDEAMTTDELIAENYRGIRPAPGYPACPDHTEKATLFTLLDPERASMSLTEHFAMLPAAAVAGLVLLASRRALFRRRQNRPRSGRRLRAPQGSTDRGSRTLAQAESGVLSRAGSGLVRDEVHRRENERREDRQHRHDIGFLIAPVLGFGVGHGGLWYSG